MTARLNYAKLMPGGYQAMLGVEKYLSQSTIDAKLRQLVALRASQINHCAFCIDMHSHELRKEGETQLRIDLLPAWREVSIYTAREKAALAWTEAGTILAPEFMPDSLFAEVRKEFSEQELADLTLQVAQINSWNRLSVAMRAVPASLATAAAA
jgi:AhpD family alkylhydroperoxidase